MFVRTLGQPCYDYRGSEEILPRIIATGARRKPVSRAAMAKRIFLRVKCHLSASAV